MSLAPKIEEIALTITQQDIDIVFITKTWLRQSIPNDPINIKGYQLFRRDRTNRLHGGVCLYVKNCIESKILTDLYNDDHEVLWYVPIATKTPASRILTYHSCSCLSSSRCQQYLSKRIS